MTWCKQSNMGW